MSAPAPTPAPTARCGLSQEMILKLEKVTFNDEICHTKVKVEGKVEECGSLFSEHRSDQTVNIAASSSAIKRVAEYDIEDSSAKRQKQGVHVAGLSRDVLRAMKERREAMLSVKLDESSFSSPKNVHNLPFPQTLSPLPIDRFRIARDGTFSFMGREAFDRVFRQWEAAFVYRTGLMEMNVYGTSGYGKSHILAALVVQLVRLKVRVVYISDCYRLVKDRVATLRAALVAAFIDDDDRRTEALEAEVEADLERFCRRLNQDSILATFIIDQANAFDPNPDVAEGPETLKAKGAAKELVDHCSFGHVLVRGASANNETAKHFRHRQVSAVGETIDLNGGFSETEMQAWSERHKADLPLGDVIIPSLGAPASGSAAPAPADAEADWNRLLYYTGQVPLFLFAFLDIVKDRRARLPVVATDFDSCWQEFVQLKRIQIIESHLRDLLGSIISRKSSDPAGFSFVQEFLRGCITETSVPRLLPTQYDCRYFWSVMNSGRCLTGFVRDTMAMLFTEMSVRSDWLAPAYLFSAILGSQNPSVRGFLVEQACIHAILSSSAEYLPGLTFRPSSVRYFDAGTEPNTFVPDAFCTLYVPRPFNYRAVDAVLRILPAHARGSDFIGVPLESHMVALQAKTAIVVAIQITLSSVKKHESSLPAFFASRQVWLKHLVKVDGTAITESDVDWIFHWIVPQSEARTHADWRTIHDAIQRSTRSGIVVSVPKHTQFIRSIEDITQRPDLLRTPPALPSK